jgi:hypothetical protein
MFTTSPAVAAAELRKGCNRENFLDLEDVDAWRIACWLDELAALRAESRQGGG